MIAPVRETCAQALAVTVKFLQPRIVTGYRHEISSVNHVYLVNGLYFAEVMTVLATMSRQKDWEVRHAGFLGMKYILCTREVRCGYSILVICHNYSFILPALTSVSVRGQQQRLVKHVVAAVYIEISAG